MRNDDIDADPIEEPEDLRSRRRNQTMFEVHRTAVKLFLERGYPATTVGTIARAAGISERTFFRYFPTKEDVLVFPHTYGNVETFEFDGGLPDVLPALESFLRRRFRRAGADTTTFDELHALLEKEPPLIGILQAKIDEDFDSFLRVLSEAIPARDGQDVRLLIHMAFATAKATIESWADRGAAAETLVHCYDANCATLRRVAPLIR